MTAEQLQRMEGHTPGEWVVDLLDEHGRTHFEINASRATAIADVCGCLQSIPDAQWSMVKANAYLIGASPRLLAERNALLEAVKRLADTSATVGNLDHAGVPVPADAWADMYSANNAARAAIAIAESE